MAPPVQPAVRHMQIQVRVLRRVLRQEGGEGVRGARLVPLVEGRTPPPSPACHTACSRHPAPSVQPPSRAAPVLLSRTPTAVPRTHSAQGASKEQEGTKEQSQIPA